MCDHIVEIDKSRVLDYYCTCSEEEMRLVDDALRFSLGLGGAGEVGETGDRVEADMYRRMYEKVLDELVKLKLELDLSKKTCEAKELPKPKAKVKREAKVNINTATAEEIAKTLGIGLTLAHMITGYRRDNGNFVDMEELRDVPELSEDFVETYGDKIIIDSKNDQIKKSNDEIEPKPIGKVNVNTATPEEIRAKTGLGRVACEEIRAYRNKNGPFQGVEELLNLRHFGATCMKRYGAMLEV
jgi:competence ComEA-like helix-hairpin-helix protein